MSDDLDRRVDPGVGVSDRVASGAIADVPDIAQPVLIGQGGFAAVYRAIDLLADRPVAVKLLTQRPDEAALRSFERERVALARLSTHPNVVTLHRTGVTDQGHPYLVMELATGGSLSDQVSDRGPLPWSVAVDRILPVCDALEHAHGQGIQHRDIKPQNILISAHDQPLLSDFGIARLTAPTDTVTQRPGLSLSYASPEQIDGLPLDHRTDIYSLGATLYALIAGRPAFTDPERPGLLPTAKRIVAEPVPPLAGDVPPAVSDTIVAAMAKRPEDRPTIEVWRRALRGEVDVAPSPPGEPATETTTERPGPPLLGPPAIEANERSGRPPLALTPDSDATVRGGPRPVHLPQRRWSARTVSVAALILLLVAGALAIAWTSRDGEEAAAGTGDSATDGGSSTLTTGRSDGDRPGGISSRAGEDGSAEGAGPPTVDGSAPSRSTTSTPPDDDGDGIADPDDNCPTAANPDQVDLDDDGIGDECDPDRDGDAVADASDNCPIVPNPDQVDVDTDQIGDACDELIDRDGDGIDDADDPCIVSPGAPDADGDGTPDECDATPRGMVVVAASMEVTQLTILNTAYGDGETDLFGDLKIDDTKVHVPEIPDQRDIRPSNWFTDRVPVDEGAPLVRFRVWIRDEDDCLFCRDGLVDLSPVAGADALHLVADTRTGEVEVADEDWNRVGPAGRLTGSDDGDLSAVIVQEGDDDGIHRGSVWLRLTLVRQPAP